MRIMPQITFRGVEPSLAVEKAVRARAARLDRYADQINTCRVLIESSPRQVEAGRSTARLTLAIPGDELTIAREVGGWTGAKDLPAAIRGVFDAAGRLLEDENRGRPHSGRYREPLPRAHVRMVMRDQDRGLLEAADGREVYFDKDSLVNASLDSLVVGSEVVYIDGFGDQGLRASVVRVLHPAGVA